ncbi:ribonuclease D [Pseudoalteromonas spongiae]|uniref:ribonuclease D n=1 Tax=Pseudoalteromonas spongiae TaxID=298657 RepID=UPI00026CAEA8|nr:ribonuclease D [Pseudoalteromonas spongiae]ATD00797.1 ribonuclease D [Pseudoalteromonas spongiae UST010723-006]
MQYSFITEQQELDSAVASYNNKSVLAVDTEFMRRRTLYPELALLQIYDGDRICLIDPTLDLDLSSFWQLMENPNIIKVLHSPSEDLEVFARHGNCTPAPLFDTQFALSLLGERNCVGFANMVEMLLEEQIDKSESRTNWLQRPLTKAQLDYAAADVFYLMPCFNIIKEKLNDDKQGIVFGESAVIANKRKYETPLELAYLDIKNAWQLNPKQLAVLQQLAAWRLNRAREKNLALNFIVKEHILFEIAKTQPTHFGALKRLCEGDQGLLNRYGKTLLNLVKIGLDKDEAEHPEKIQRLIDFHGYKKTLKELRAELEKIAKDNDIPLDVLASKKQMNQLISWKWKGKSKFDEGALLKPDLMTSWRGEMVKHSLKDWF